MKVEYILQLWNSFNKKIWTNKSFSIFLYIFIIVGTTLLRQTPTLYYGLLERPLYLTIIVFIVLVLSSYNMILGILLTVSVLGLYYPSMHLHYNSNSVEGFNIDENNDTQDEKDFKLKTVDPTDNNIDADDVDADNVDADDVDADDIDADNIDVSKDVDGEDDKKPKKKEHFNKKRKIVRGLEDINPEFFIKKDDEKDNEIDDEPEDTKNVKEKYKSKDKSKQKSDPTEKTKESFLGELREVFYDLDSGRNKMNAKTAVKKITDMIYHKRRNEVEKILQEDDDHDSDTDSDEDYF